MVEKRCGNCGRTFKPIKKYRNQPYCSKCRYNHKNCEVCGKEIFAQGRTCSKSCANILKKQSWMKSCGAPHNFSKQSLSRKVWETRLMEEEGITNVFQRQSVKDKAKETLIKKYGIEYITQSPEIKKRIAEKMEGDGV